MERPVYRYLMDITHNPPIPTAVVVATTSEARNLFWVGEARKSPTPRLGQATGPAAKWPWATESN